MTAAFRFRRRPVARRLMMRLGMVGLMMVLLVSGVQLAFEYGRDLDRLMERLDHIEEGYLAAVVETTWLEDRERLDLLVMGIHRLPSVERVEVRAPGGRVLARAGHAATGETIERAWPLVREYHGRDLLIGELSVSATLSAIRAQAAQRALTAAAANLALLVTAVAVLYLTVYRMVTHPLGAMAAYARRLAAEGLHEPPPAEFRSSEASDEFSDLAVAFDDLRTELGRSLEALTVSETRYRELFRGSPVSLWEEDFSEVKRRLDTLRPQVTDLACYLDARPEILSDLAAAVRIIDVNDSAVALHRAASREDLLAGLPRTFTASSFGAFRRQVLAVWAGEGELVMESEVQTLDGEPRGVLVRWFVPPAFRSTMARVIVSLEDITERMRAEETLATTVEKLMQANSELERFATVAAHDLQEPVRSVVSFSQLLERRLTVSGGVDPEAKEFLDYLIAAARRMQQQVLGLVDYSRAGVSSQAFRKVALDAALAGAQDTLREAIATSDAVIESGPLPEVSGDPDQLTDVFRHLLGNAIKFHHSDSRPRVKVSAVREGGDWVVSIRDDGIGFEPRFASEIFHLYRRLHAPGARYPGTGIGLAVCRRIVERHGGRIWGESSPGTAGSTFKFTLPADCDNGV